VAAPGLTLASLRRFAIGQSLLPATTLRAGIARLGFVQADPIRSPARAQDLILRQRVGDYKAGDLERQYASLDVEEDYLYAYGFLTRRVWQLLHPRKAAPPAAFERKVLEVVRLLGEAHPRALVAHLGARRVVNAWGGYSKATTHALEWLHWRGLLRVARRENGVRVYGPASPLDEAAPPGDRLRALIATYAHIFAPSPETSLQSVIARHKDLGSTRTMLKVMIARGELQQATADGISYVWPGDAAEAEAPRQVRFLAPFDPVVWDRSRFEHLWGWAYRFEAYTPAKLRVRGYYAMPMLWGSEFIGWANAGREPQKAAAGRLDIQVGFVGKRPRGREFGRELDAEIARLEAFLTPRTT
jgi:uncharacterized protein YcaQ